MADCVFGRERHKVTHDPRFFPTCGAAAAGWRIYLHGLRRRALGRRSDLAFYPFWRILERYPSIQPAGVPGLGGGHRALALDQRQNYPGPTGFRRDGRVGYLADAAVPAAQAADRLFAELTGIGRCRLYVRLPGRNWAAVT